jgi:DNA-3-methyladenine glycosylase II
VSGSTGRSSIRQLTHDGLREATRQLAARDRDLAAVVERFGAPPMWGRRPEFATLVRIIIEQQVSLAAARTMYDRLRTAVGVVTPGSIHHVGIVGLRALGFTGQKSSYCVGLAGMILDGKLDLGRVARAETRDGRAMLLSVRGLGAWSVDIYFLMALRRPDIWPHGDLALADATHKVKRLPARPDYRALTAMAEQWAPFRSVAARILWHHYLSTRAVPTT